VAKANDDRSAIKAFDEELGMEGQVVIWILV
jgi:hypothetical protein